jgi:TRAP-type C4-dicarboxylate transport system substrate-binding protein
MFLSVARIAGAVLIATVAFGRPGAADPIQLKLATFGPPQSYFYAEVVLPWAQAASKDSAGTVEIKHFGGGVLGNAGNMFDAVMSGAADIGWALPHAVPSKFVKSTVIELPFGYEDGESGAVAYWRLYAKGLIASDFDGVKLFGLTAWPAAALQMKAKKIQKVEDLKGLKLRVAGKLQADTAAALGVTPVSVPVDELYQAIDRGVIDGAWGSLTGTKQFRLYEVCRQFLDVSLNGAGGMLVMKQEKFDRLPAAAKAAFDKHSGEALSRALGRSNDGEVVRVKELLASLAKQGKLEAMRTLPPDEIARWKKAIEPVAEAWASRVPDGRAILEAFRAEVASARKGG